MTDQRPTEFVPVTVRHARPAGQAVTETPQYSSRGRGRPSGLTREVEERILTAMRSGADLRDACEYAGQSYSTVTQWIARGEGRNHKRPPTPEYTRFARLVRMNVAGARVFASAALLANAERSGKAATDWLDIHGNEEWREARRQIRERDGEPPPGAPAPTGQDAAPPTVYQQNLTLIEVPEDQMPELLHQLIVTARSERAKVVSEPELMMDEIPDGHRSPRLDGLRASG